MRLCLVKQVQAKHRRGRLAPVDIDIGVVAIDGKGLDKGGHLDHPDIQAIGPEGRPLTGWPACIERI